MSSLPVRASESPFYEPFHTQTASYANVTKTISTLALLLLGYYGLSFLDAWPSTLKRSTYECVLYFTPSHLIYAMQYGLVRLGYLGQEDAKFKHANFGDMIAKQEAVRRMFGHTQLPMALRKVRTFSGPLMSFNNEAGPPGLGNWDNSCYQNSVLQGFASLPAFFRYMEQSEDLCTRHDIPATTHRAFVDFLEQLSNSISRTGVIWTPKVLKSMDSWQQQDAQEYFSRVLEVVEKEATQYATRLNRSTTAGLECLRTSETLKSVTRTENEEAILRQLETGGTSPSPGSSSPQYEVRNPIEGMTAQSLQCTTCGFTEGLSLTHFTCLTLNLGLQGDSDIDVLLDEYTAPEDVEGVECDNCTKMAQAKTEAVEGAVAEEDHSSEKTKEKIKPVLRTKAKQTTVGRLPKDLVLHINRSIFDNYGNQLKNTAPVRFPTTLDFRSRWCAPLDAVNDAVEAVYELKCVVTHYGSHHDGHYIALGKRDKVWYSFNDERVTKISEEEVLARGNGFMLFYEAEDVVAPPPKRGAAFGESAAQLGAGLDINELQAGFPSVDQEADQEPQSSADERMSKVSDEETISSQSEIDPSSGDSSRDTTPASSESSSPTKESAGQREKQSEMVFPVMKTAGDVSNLMEDEHARAASVVSVL